MKQYSIILTIHNKEALLQHVLRGLYDNTVGNYEVIFVLDGCVDKSEEVLVKFLSESPFKCYNIIHTDNLYETKANNIGLRKSVGKYSILVQDDMIVSELGWNQKLQTPCEMWSDIFAVSGRCAHSWRINSNSKHITESFNRSDCWCDILDHYNHANESNTLDNIFYIRDTVNRGPLLLKSDIIRNMGFFPEAILRQDMDDHYLCYQVYEVLGLKCGYLKVNVISKDEWGGTRINGQPKPWLLESNHNNMRLFYNKFKNRIINGPFLNESRIVC